MTCCLSCYTQILHTVAALDIAEHLGRKGPLSTRELAMQLGKPLTDLTHASYRIATASAPDCRTTVQGLDVFLCSNRSACCLSENHWWL